MSVNTIDITSGPYLGNGTGSTFSYDFRVDDELQLSVYETDDAGNQTTLTLTTDYTVAGVGVDGGGIITRVAGNLPTDYTWYIRANYIETQLTAFGSQGGFFPDVHEKAMDKLTFLIQQLYDRWAKRSIHLSDSDESAESSDMNLPALADRLSKYLGFDAEGNPITIAGAAGDVIVSAYMETLLDDANAAAALATLTALAKDGSIAMTGSLQSAKGADVASATALPLLGDGNYVDVTGVTTITSIDSINAGTWQLIRFTGVLTLTHHATNLILPGGANITTAASDHALMVEYATGKWRCISYTKNASVPFLQSDERDYADNHDGEKWPSLSVHRNGVDQTGVVSAVWTKVAFDTVDFDTNADYDPNTNYRFTPQVAGKYIMTAHVEFSVAGGTNKLNATSIYKNGTSFKESRMAVFATDGSRSSGGTVSAVIDVNGSTDYFEIFCFHNRDTDGTIEGNSEATWFTACRIG